MSTVHPYILLLIYYFWTTSDAIIWLKDYESSVRQALDFGQSSTGHRKAMASGFLQAQNILHGTVLNTASLQDFGK